MLNRSILYKARTRSELKKLISKVVGASHKNVSEDLLAILSTQIDWKVGLAKATGKTASEAARQIVRDWAATGKLDRLADIDPASHKHLLKLVRHIETLDATVSEADYWRHNAQTH